MEKKKQDWRKKVPVTTINDDLKKYKNDIYFARKVAEVNQMIANGEMPDFVYERQAVAYQDALSSSKSLATASEPQAEYGVPKDTEK